jgi:hypothetical protein
MHSALQLSCYGAYVDSANSSGGWQLRHCEAQRESATHTDKGKCCYNRHCDEAIL